MHLLKLTNADPSQLTDQPLGTAIYVNPDHVAMLQRGPATTLVALNQGVFLNVRETPDEIVRALETLGLFPVSG